MSGRVPLLAAIAANGAAGTLFAWSVLLPSLSAELDVTVDELGVVFSTGLVAFAAAMVVAGRLVDLRGPRTAVVLAGVASGCGLASAAAGRSLPVLALGVGLLGAGSGLAYLGTVSWATTVRGRPFEIGLVVAAYAAGPVAAAPLAALGAQRWGPGPVLGVAAGVVGGTMLAAAWRLPGRAGHRRAPAGSCRPASTADTAALAALWVFFFGTVTPGLLAFAYAAPIVTERGMPAGTASLVVALMAAGNLVGRLLPAPLINRTGLLPLLWGGVVALGLSLVLLSTAHAGVVLASALAVLALQYGLVSTLLPSATRPVAGDTRFAGAYGRVFSAWGVAGVVGPYLGASLHGDSDGYVRAFAFSLIFVVLAAGALAVYQHRSRPRPGP